MKLPKPPWLPPKYDDSIAFAIQALARGEASQGQQTAALKWIIEECCRTYDLSYRPDSDRDTAFAEGKRYVGTQLVTLSKLKIEKLQEA